MKTKPIPTLTTTPALERLLIEADRYRELAKEAALKLLLNPENHDQARLAKEHLLRAETFKQAAHLVAPEA